MKLIRVVPVARALRGGPVTPFEDLHSYVAIPRVTGLRLSPDGTWLAATVQQPDPDGKKYSPASGGSRPTAPVGTALRPASPSG